MSGLIRFPSALRRSGSGRSSSCPRAARAESCRRPVRDVAARSRPQSSCRQQDRPRLCPHRRSATCTGYLIALRQVGIEIILAVEHRAQVDLRVQPKPGAHRLADALLVDDRQHSGHGRIDQRDMAVGLPPKAVEAPENNFALEVTWAWTSSPITISQSPVAPLIRLDGLTGAFMRGFYSGVRDWENPHLTQLMSTLAYLLPVNMRNAGLARNTSRPAGDDLVHLLRRQVNRVGTVSRRAARAGSS